MKLKRLALLTIALAAMLWLCSCSGARNKITAVVSDTSYPFSYIGEGGEITGTSVELLRGFAEAENMELDFITANPSGTLDYLISGEAQICAFGIPSLPDTYDWETYLYSSPISIMEYSVVYSDPMVYGAIKRGDFSDIHFAATSPLVEIMLNEAIGEIGSVSLFNTDADAAMSIGTINSNGNVIQAFVIQSAIADNFKDDYNIHGGLFTRDEIAMITDREIYGKFNNYLLSVTD